MCPEGSCGAGTARHRDRGGRWGTSRASPCFPSMRTPFCSCLIPNDTGAGGLPPALRWVGGAVLWRGLAASPRGAGSPEAAAAPAAACPPSASLSTDCRRRPHARARRLNRHLCAVRVTLSRAHRSRGAGTYGASHPSGLRFGQDQLPREPRNDDFLHPSGLTSDEGCRRGPGGHLGTKGTPRSTPRSRTPGLTPEGSPAATLCLRPPSGPGLGSPGCVRARRGGGCDRADLVREGPGTFASPRVTQLRVGSDSTPPGEKWGDGGSRASRACRRRGDPQYCAHLPRTGWTSRPVSGHRAAGRL